MRQPSPYEMTEPAQPQPASPKQPEAPPRQAYLDIVWQQFRRNPFAYMALWLLVPMFLSAIYAPLIASDQPFVFVDGEQVIYPWWHSLFHPPEWVDLMFNMAMLVSVPFLPLALILNFIWKRRSVSGRARLIRLLTSYTGLSIAVLLVVLGVKSAAERYPDHAWLQNLLPKNTYSSRQFSIETMQAPQERYGWYPPIPFGTQATDLSINFQPPSSGKDPAEWIRITDSYPHLLGTDNVGHDVLTLMLYGTRISMTIGFVAAAIALVIGCCVGAMAGYFGGWIDMLVSRTIEIVLLFPSFFLILTLVALIGPSIYIIMIVIGFTGWPTVARLIRGEVLKQRSMEYTLAAQAIGAKRLRIVFRHILPNAIAPALVAAPFDIASAITTEAGLSLLGVGGKAATPSWGKLLSLVKDNYSYWWLIVFPSIAIFVTVTIFNLVGSGLRDAMDPRLRKAA